MIIIRNKILELKVRLLQTAYIYNTCIENIHTTQEEAMYLNDDGL